MSFKKYLRASVMAFLAVFFVCERSIAQQKKADYTKYYVSNLGDDNNPGTIEAPFKTIQKINGLKVRPRTIICFKGGDTFKGTLVVGSEKAGRATDRVAFLSYGKGVATIDGDSVRAISVYKTSHVLIRNLKLIGLGRKTGNRENGIATVPGMFD